MNPLFPTTSSKTVEQSGTIPYRASEDGIRVLLVTSRSKGSWIFPKGTIENGFSSVETAEKETFEEAGVRGRIHLKPAGDYRYRKNGKAHRVCLYWLEVVEELSVWPEPDRQRRWADWDEAVRLVGYKTLKIMMETAKKPWEREATGES